MSVPVLKWKLCYEESNVKICTSTEENWRQVLHSHDQLILIRLYIQITEFFSRKNLLLPENKKTTSLFIEMCLHCKIIGILCNV